jgi:hypothetical protein
MAVVNWCQGFYRLRIYHLTTGAICAPPLTIPEALDCPPRPITASLTATKQ